MRFSVVTLFPEMFSGVLDHSILGRARQRSLLEVEMIQIRDHARDRHRTVDDAPYGGGPGMLLKVDVLDRALGGISGIEDSWVVYLSPQGKRFGQEDALRFGQMGHVVLVCGHYEGVDERFVAQRVDEELSLGDFVLTGGEIAAMAVLDATARLLPGILGDEESFQNDSFFHGLLDHPQYTRPATWQRDGLEEVKVPEVLLSGHHAQVEAWRRRQAFVRTWVRRPDLLNAAQLDRAEKKLVEAISRDFDSLGECEGE